MITPQTVSALLIALSATSLAWTQELKGPERPGASESSVTSVLRDDSPPEAVLPATPQEAESTDSPGSGAADSVVPDTVGKASAIEILESADPADFDARKADRIWMISSRRVCSRHSPSTSLSYRRRIDGDQWSDETFESFSGPADDGRKRRTVIYIHGNRTTSKDALKDGLAVYDQTYLEWKDAPPVRFVIWTWPADRVGGEIKDVRTKAAYAEQHSFHLARLLTQMNEHQQVSIIGYSFGGRLAINALHLVGGGSIDGWGIETQDDNVPTINLTLIAPAIRNDCFCCDKWMALSTINHLFIMYNSKDIYLRFYKIARFDFKNDALGFTGMQCYRRGCLSVGQFEQFDASSSVGRDHNYLSYIVDKRVEKLVRKNLHEEDR